MSLFTSNKQDVFFSLILATIYRVNDVDNFLASLLPQSFKFFEVIIVDQNDDDRLVDVVNKYSSSIRIKHVRSEKGLSKARNVGFNFAIGKFIGYPDDDCLYQPTTLSDVHRLFSESTADVITGRTTSEDGKTERVWPNSVQKVNSFTVWRTAISFTIFVRRDFFNTYPNFDESLGVGAGTKWGSGEETDFLLRTLKLGGEIVYSPSVHIFHPVKITELSNEDLQRAVSYARGAGRVIRLNYSNIFIIGTYLIAPFIKSLIYLFKFNGKAASFNYRIFTSKVSGFFDAT